ncbi:AAA family ATPase [Butyrivibrio fibrisolvens]|uniref:Magnesium chelatase n=1 Tax=Butyrivibrio fibrisolvens TaxID=831 RepID=A0A317FZ11_BUTFI|nr:MoxR family ATPase [Butyrivibrio fibrisolvens]PWT26964.1 magnesium chelatase [Butyrivibrio fibrisolvens]
MNTDKISILKDNIGKVIVGKDHVVELALCALIANGHVLLEDVPGTGKTVLAKSIAASAGIDFERIQFTPDLLPTDITGLNVVNVQNGEFSFHKGPVFTSILLADEINRATPRTQAGLLECMEERQVTVDGVTRKLPDTFFVIATQNPIETAGTFPLPEAQLDRFMMKLSMGFPSQDEEKKILERALTGDRLKALEAVVTGEDILAWRQEASSVSVHSELVTYITDIVKATRNRSDVAAGVSPRGSIALLRCAQALAFIRGREYVVPEDIKELAVPVLAHRLVIPHTFGKSSSCEDIILKILDEVPVPTEEFR